MRLLEAALNSIPLIVNWLKEIIVGLPEAVSISSAAMFAVIIYMLLGKRVPKK